MSESSPLTVSLAVDYSNGNRKHFSRLQLFPPADVVDVLDAAKAAAPGLDFTFSSDFVDRGGREVGAITEVDGVESSEDRRWGVWVGATETSEVRAHVEGTVSPTGVPNVEDGDSVVLKLVS